MTQMKTMPFPIRVIREIRGKKNSGTIHQPQLRRLLRRLHHVHNPPSVAATRQSAAIIAPRGRIWRRSAETPLRRLHRHADLKIPRVILRAGQRGDFAPVVAQICNLLYRGFTTCGASRWFESVGKFARSAECNSAIRQNEILRYEENRPCSPVHRAARHHRPRRKPALRPPP